MFTISRSIWSKVIITGLLVLFCVNSITRAEAIDSASIDTDSSSAESMIQLHLPRNVELGVLTDYISERLGMNILCSESIAKNKITIHSPSPVPESSLEDLYRSILKLSGFVLVEADQPGWWKIVADRELLTLTDRFESSTNPSLQATDVVSRIFTLVHIDAAEADKTIRPLLSKPGGFIQLPTNSLMIVTDYADNIDKINNLLRMADTFGDLPEIYFYKTRHITADKLAISVNDIWQKRIDALGGENKRKAMLPSILADTRNNRLVIIAYKTVKDEVFKLIESFDTEEFIQTKGYSFKHTSAQRVDKMIRQLLVSGSPDSLKTIIDTESDKLFIAASPDMHQSIEKLLKELDVPSGIETRSYKLQFVTPTRVQTLLQNFLAGGSRSSKSGTTFKSSCDDESGLLIVNGPQSVHDRVRNLIEDLDKPDDAADSPVRFYKLYNTVASEVLSTIRSLTESSEDLSAIATGLESEDITVKTPANSSDSDFKPIKSEDATISVDENTNSIIVIAPPAAQVLYEKLISMLDKRRPQVMVEVLLVTIDKSDSFSLGVEMSYINDDVDPRHFTFSAFGMTIDAETGDTISPGMGFTGAVIDSDTFQAVVHALATDGNSRVLAAPRILANDNGTATLSSISEAPYTSVNASDTVATTSFGGYASAGTTVSVTPHISEGDFLQLQYSVTLNSFTGAGAGGIPPPRQTNTIDSEITIPDGHAVIVGGLTRKDDSDTASKVPLLGDIPWLGHLFSSTSNNESESTLFVFIRPVILRDDMFADLKAISSKSLADAGLPANKADAAAEPEAEKLGTVMLME